MSGSTKRAASGSPQKPPSASHEVIHGAPLVHRLATDVVLQYVAGARVLDLGGAVPLVADTATGRAASIESAALPARGERLPHNDDAFDVAVCLRSLPFLHPESAESEAHATAIVQELARVVAPGGVLLIDIDNPQSLRGAFFGVRHPMKALEAGPLVVQTDDGPDRFDTLGRFVGHLPPSLELVNLHGLQVLAAHHELHRTPILGGLLARAEWWVRDLGLTRRFGAHLLLVLRKLPAADLRQ